MMILNFTSLSYDCLNFCKNWFIKTLITCFLKPTSKVSTQKVSLKVYKKLLKVKFFCIFLPSNQKLTLNVVFSSKLIVIFPISYPFNLTSFLGWHSFLLQSFSILWSFSGEMKLQFPSLFITVSFSVKNLIKTFFDPSLI